MQVYDVNSCSIKKLDLIVSDFSIERGYFIKHGL